MPRKYITVYDILGVFVRVHPICRNPAHQLAIRKKMDILNGDIARRTNAILKILNAFLILITKPYINRLLFL